MSNNILKITFNASTVTGIIIKDVKYTPSMSQPQLYGAFPNILFIPTIKLKKNMFDKDFGLFDNTLDENDIKKIFLSTSQLNNFIERLQEKKKYNPIKLSEAKKKGIIYNNIKFILDLFFKKGDKFYIYQKIYLINNYNWNDKYNMSPVAGQNIPIFEVNIDLILHEGSELSFFDSTRLNCVQKRNSIVNDYYELVGLNKPLPKTAKLIEQPVDMSIKHVPKTLNKPLHVTTPIAIPTAVPIAVPINDTYSGGRLRKTTKLRNTRSKQRKSHKKRH